MKIIDMVLIEGNVTIVNISRVGPRVWNGHSYIAPYPASLERLFDLTHRYISEMEFLPGTKRSMMVTIINLPRAIIYVPPKSMSLGTISVTLDKVGHETNQREEG